MNRRLLIILLAAFVIAAFCAFLVYRLVGVRIATAKQVPTTTVVAAAADLKIGTLISAQNLTTTKTVGTPPKGTITDPKEAIGRGVTSTIYAGEPIMESRLAAKGSGAGLASIIQQGMRAIAIHVDQVVGVAGFVLPGMKVDVLISGVPPGNPDPRVGTQERTLLQNITVLSAGTDIEKDQAGKARQVPVVSLLVTPEQAQTLALATAQTKIQLVLRNPLDSTIVKVPGTAMMNLFQEANAPKPRVSVGPRRAKPAPQYFSVTVYNGSKRSEEKFAMPEGKQ